MKNNLYKDIQSSFEVFYLKKNNLLENDNSNLTVLVDLLELFLDSPSRRLLNNFRVFQSPVAIDTVDFIRFRILLSGRA